MELNYKKLMAGLYEVTVDGERAGVIGKSVNGTWTGTDCSTGAGTAFHATRKAATEALIQERAEILAEIAAAKKIVDQERAQESYEDICKREMAEQIAKKIQPLPLGTKKEAGMEWIGEHLYRLEGSALMDFDEFMFLYSYGSAYNTVTQEKLAEEYSEGDESGIDGHFQNFVDTWADYKRAWKKANENSFTLCDCCKGDINFMGSKRAEDGPSGLIRYFTCDECKGSGIKMVPAASQASTEITFEQVEYKRESYTVKKGSQYYGTVMKFVSGEWHGYNAKYLQSTGISGHKTKEQAAEALIQVIDEELEEERIMAQRAAAPAHNPGILEKLQEKIQKESWLKLDLQTFAADPLQGAKLKRTNFSGQYKVIQSGLLLDLQAFAAAEPEVIHSIDRALWEIKEAGEVRISMVILDPVENFLRENEIEFIKSKVDWMTWDIIQVGDPVEGFNDLGIAGTERP